VFETSAFNFDARRESFAKAQNKFAACFLRQIVAESMHSHLRLRAFCRFGFSLPKLTRIIHYCSVLDVNKILCHNDITTTVVVAALVSLLLFSCKIRSWRFVSVILA